MKYLLPLTVLLFAGCGDSATTESDTNDTSVSTASSIDGSSFLAETEPEAAVDVIKARADATDGGDVVVVGRIGGDYNPWVDGMAVFRLVDRSLKPCNEIPGDECPVPWDYCCETDKLPTSMVLVKFNDENGRPLAAGAKELFKVKELDTVVISGKVQKDDAGNVTVLASKMFVRK
ncbi:MAG: hypothetical protein AB8G99_19985 [Planctomycetaceae bacterium]